jgi:glucose-6-phosphate-specific signal transduction histidine kinase
MNARERALILLLRLTGGLLVLAFFAVLLPTEWMATTHRWLGLGEFPRAPLVDYLTRSASALYCIHGGLMLVLSRDVRRFAPVVVYVAVAGIVFGAAMIAIDLGAGMPMYWTLGEGPTILVVGLITLWLARGIQPPGAASS